MARSQNDENHVRIRGSSGRHNLTDVLPTITQAHLHDTRQLLGIRQSCWGW